METKHRLDDGSLSMILGVMDDFNDFYELLEQADSAADSLVVRPQSIAGLSDLQQYKVIKGERNELRAQARARRKQLLKKFRAMKVKCHEIHEHLCFLRIKFMAVDEKRGYNRKS